MSISTATRLLLRYWRCWHEHMNQHYVPPPPPHCVVSLADNSSISTPDVVKGYRKGLCIVEACLFLVSVRENLCQYRCDFALLSKHIKDKVGSSNSILGDGQTFWHRPPKSTKCSQQSYIHKDADHTLSRFRHYYHCPGLWRHQNKKGIL